MWKLQPFRSTLFRLICKSSQARYNGCDCADTPSGSNQRLRSSSSHKYTRRPVGDFPPVPSSCTFPFALLLTARSQMSSPCLRVHHAICMHETSLRPAHCIASAPVWSRESARTLDAVIQFLAPAGSLGREQAPSQTSQSRKPGTNSCCLS